MSRAAAALEVEPQPELHPEDCLCVECDDVPVFPPCHNIDPAVPVTLAEAASWES